MPIIFAAIAPHGFPIIPELSDDAEGAMATRRAMQEMQKRAKVANLDAIVIAGPHGFRVDGAICLAEVARGCGALNWNGRTIEMVVPVDAVLTDAIAAHAREAHIPVAMAGYGGNRRYQSTLPIDWGVITPLWFLGHDVNRPGMGDVLANHPEDFEGPPVVIITPSRSLPRQQMIEFGHAIADAAAADGRRIAFIASCDWGHCHREDGPYGYNAASARIDKVVVDAVKREDLGSLMTITEQDAQDAAIDGLWQTLILHGVLERAPMAVHFLSYEAPTYYGMLVAVYAVDSS